MVSKKINLPSIDKFIEKGMSENEKKLIILCIKICEDIPFLYEGLYYFYGYPEEPSFELPTVFIASIDHYLKKLFQDKKVTQINIIFEYFNNLYINGDEEEKYLCYEFVYYLYLVDEFYEEGKKLLSKELFEIHEKHYGPNSLWMSGRIHP